MADAKRPGRANRAPRPPRGGGPPSQASGKKRKNNRAQNPFGGGEGACYANSVRKAKSSPPSRRVVRAGHQAPTCRWGAGGPREGAVGTTSPQPLDPENKRGVRGDLSIGRCPGGTKGSLTPREDRRNRRARRVPTPPARRFRWRLGRLPAAENSGCPRWTCFARRIGPWSAPFLRVPPTGAPQPRAADRTRPRDVRPLPARPVRT
jgi:hypothetical protein